MNQPLSSTAILSQWVAGKSPQLADFAILLAMAQSNPQQAQALDADLSLTGMEQRAKTFVAIAPTVLQLCDRLNLTNQHTVLTSLWELWLPLAAQLRYARQQQDQPLIQGILGSQGAGKTTLCQVLQVILNHWHYPCIALSLDDLYKTYSDRQALLKTQPQLIWRGPPGTHDIDLGLQVLTQLQQANFGEQIALPRFDKSRHQGAGDRIAAELIHPAEIILFEGWFVGCQPINLSHFDQPPEPIVTATDRQFAQAMNKALGDYLPLWEKLDRLIILSPTDYRFSKQWRRDAEHQMIAQGKTGMTDAEIDAFVDYFWRSLHPELFIQPLMQNPELTDLVIEIDRNHCPQRIYAPANLT